MSNFIQKIVDFILKRRKSRLENLKNSLKPKTYTNSTTKTHIDANTTMRLTTETEKNKEKMDFCVKNIILQNIETPENLLVYIKEHGTGVWKPPFADKILSVIKEEEGFITPLRGLKALYLNIALGIFTEKKFSLALKTDAMFVLRDLPVNIYYMIHQFHKWYGFTMNLPGYDEETQENFKKAFSDIKEGDFSGMSVGEIIGLKEAIARDAEAIDFVIKLAKEKSGAKKALDKMKKDGGANI